MENITEKKRLLFVDLLRGWAIIIMIEVHVFNAFLTEPLRKTYWFAILDYFNGLVAPSFLFISGFIFVLLSFKKAPEFRKFGYSFYKQLRRILLIWVIAYLMHVPYYSLKSIIQKANYSDFLLFFQSDVLHTIAFGLTILFFGSIFIKSTKIFQLFNLVSGLIIIFVAPFLWDIDFTKIIHPFFAGYMNGQHHSIFPLFPWLGYILLGGALAPIYQKAKSENNELSFFNKTLLIALALMFATALLKQIHIYHPAISSTLRCNPFFNLHKIGIVLALISFCWYFEYFRKPKNSFIIDCSKESLLIYFVHIELIYGAFFNYKSINHYFGSSFNFWECFIATVVLILMMIGLAKFWNYIKSHFKQLAEIIIIAVLCIIIFNFAIKEFIF